MRTKAIALALAIAILLSIQPVSAQAMTRFGIVYVNVSGTLWPAPNGTVVSAHLNDAASPIATSVVGDYLMPQGYYYLDIGGSAGDNVTFKANGLSTNVTSIPWTLGCDPFCTSFFDLRVDCGDTPCIGKVNETLVSTTTGPTGSNQTEASFLFTYLLIDTGNTTMAGGMTVLEYTYSVTEDRAPPGVNNLSSNFGLGSNQNYAGKYVDVRVGDAMNNQISWVELRMYYTDDDLDLDGDGVVGEVGDLNEDTLGMWWYNASSGRWLPLNSGSNYEPEGPQVFGTARNTSNVTLGGINYSGYVSANLSRLSVYGLAGSIITAPAPAPAVVGGAAPAAPRPPTLREGVNILTPELMRDIIVELNIIAQQFYDAPDTMAATLLLTDGYPTGVYPSPTEVEIVKSALTKPIQRLVGEVYDLAAERVLKKYTFADTLVIARGDLAVDSMAAVGYAKARKYPILLTKPGELPTATLEAAKKLKPKTIVIVGGPVAVSTGVEAELARIAPVRRIWGRNREETALALAREILRPRIIVIADGREPNTNAAVLSGDYGVPLLYVRGDEVPKNVGDYLREHRTDAYGRPMRIVLVGVSEGAQKEIESLMK